MQYQGGGGFKNRYNNIRIIIIIIRRRTQSYFGACQLSNLLPKCELLFVCKSKRATAFILEKKEDSNGVFVGKQR
jgi:hypothetical protein